MLQSGAGLRCLRTGSHLEAAFISGRGHLGGIEIDTKLAACSGTCGCNLALRGHPLVASMSVASARPRSMLGGDKERFDRSL